MWHNRSAQGLWMYLHGFRSNVQGLGQGFSGVQKKKKMETGIIQRCW